MSPITEPYLLCVCVPISIDSEGRRWTDELWAKDLELHLDYIHDLTIACPIVHKQPCDRDTCLSESPFDRLKFIDLPYPRSYGAAIRSLPRFVGQLWSGARKASIVHSGFGGWPIAEGWLLTPIGKIQRKLVVTNVESSFWRSTGLQVPWRKKILSSVMEQLTRFAVRIADLRFFTSKAYAAEFLPEHAPRTFVVPATWVNEEWILSEKRAAAAWDAKEGATRLIFAGRLVADKGVDILLEAIDLATAARIDVTIIGEGPMRDQCLRAVHENHGSVSVRFLDPVQYGEPFLATLRSQDAVLLPCLSSEQPRLLYDAFSQAVPVIGSATGGICEVMEEGVTGRLVPPGDVRALAQALIWASRNRTELRRMGLASLHKAHEATHRAMHSTRHEILLQALAERARNKAGKGGDEPVLKEAGFRAKGPSARTPTESWMDYGRLMTGVVRDRLQSDPTSRD